MATCQIKGYFTDAWESYEKALPATKHHIGKDGTQRIERKNLNFRTHLKRMQRKTIAFSKTDEMHINVIKLYIHALNSGQHHF